MFQKQWAPVVFGHQAFSIALFIGIPGAWRQPSAADLPLFICGTRECSIEAGT